MRQLPTIAVAAALAVGCQRRSQDRPHEQVDPSQPPAAQPAARPTPSPAARPPVPPLPDPLPGVRKDVTSTVGTAWRAAIADLDGDGAREIVVVDSSHM